MHGAATPGLIVASHWSILSFGRLLLYPACSHFFFLQPVFTCVLHTTLLGSLALLQRVFLLFCRLLQRLSWHSIDVASPVALALWALNRPFRITLKPKLAVLL